MRAISLHIESPSYVRLNVRSPWAFIAANTVVQGFILVIGSID